MAKRYYASLPNGEPDPEAQFMYEWHRIHAALLNAHCHFDTNQILEREGINVKITEGDVLMAVTRIMGHRPFEEFLK